MSLLTFFAGLATQTVAWALVHATWQAALIAGWVAVALRIRWAGSARQRHALVLTALALIAALPIATAAASGLRAADAALSLRVPWLDEAVAEGSQADDRARSPATATGATRPRRGLTAGIAGIPWPTAILALWVLGCAVGTIRMAGGWWWTRRLRARSTPAPPSIGRIVVELAARLGLRAIEARLSHGLDGPALVGTRRPMLLLPAALADRLGADALRQVLAHELAHLERRDPWTHAFARLVRTLLFFHPGVRWLERRLSVERELCCDERAVAITRDVAGYVGALIRAEELRATGPLPALPLSGADLRGRVRHLLRDRPTRGGRAWWLAIPLAVAGSTMPLLASELSPIGPLTLPRARDVARGVVTVARPPARAVLDALVDGDPTTVLAASADEQQRARAARLLALSRDASHVGPLVEALETGSPALRSTAATGLGLLGHAGAAAALGRHAMDDPDPEVRASSHLALGLVGSAASLEIARAGLADPDPSVRERAVVALGLLGDKRVVADLTRTADRDPHPAVREKADKVRRWLLLSDSGSR